MQNELKKNKALFILPLVMLPFVVLIFWVLGGGTASGEKKNKDRLTTGDGVNYLLPEAEKSIKIYDKMEAYQQDGQLARDMLNPDLRDSLKAGTGLLKDSLPGSEVFLEQQYNSDALLAHIRDKEKQLQQELGKDSGGQKEKAFVAQGKQNRRVNTVTDHPKKTIPKQTPVTGIDELDEIIDQNRVLNRKNDSLLSSLRQVQDRLQQIEAARNRSFSLEKQRSSGFSCEQDGMQQLIKAEIYETATVLNGNRVKIRLLESTQVNGQEIPRNTFVYGTCKIKNERLQIEITHLPLKDSFIPVKLSIYDLDGMEGLYVPDNAARKVYREVGASVNTSSLTGVSDNPLTYTGIRAADRAAQTMLKRVRLKKVRVRKNTRIYIINQN